MCSHISTNLVPALIFMLRKVSAGLENIEQLF